MIVETLSGHFNGNTFSINIGEVPKNRFIHNIDIIINVFKEVKTIISEKSVTVVSSNSWELKLSLKDNDHYRYSISSDGLKLREELFIPNLISYSWNPADGNISYEEVNAGVNATPRQKSVIYGNVFKLLNETLNTIVTTENANDRDTNLFNILLANSFEELSKNPSKVTLIGFDKWHADKILLACSSNDTIESDPGVKEEILKSLSEYKVDVNLPYYLM